MKEVSPDFVDPTNIELRRVQQMEATRARVTDFMANKLSELGLQESFLRDSNTQSEPNQ